MFMELDQARIYLSAPPGKRVKLITNPYYRYAYLDKKWGPTKANNRDSSTVLVKEVDQGIVIKKRIKVVEDFTNSEKSSD
jgi:hypothetical protein